MAAPGAEVEHLSKAFADITALRDVSLRVDPGQVHGLLGANGAGKSTLMRCLLGYLKPTEGTVTVLEGDSRTPRLRARVGYLPGDLRLPQRSTVTDILDFHARLLKRAGRPAVLRDALTERLDLPVTRRFGALSKGNRQKVGLVLALMAEPDVLVLDEPTSGLDPLMQAEVHDLVRERRAEGAAILLSTHILAEAEAVADRVAVLSQGRLVADRSLESLLEGARQSVDVSLDSEPPPDLLAAVPGLVCATISGTDVHVVITGSLSVAMSRLAPFGIRRVVSKAHELDVMFQQASEPTL